MKIFVYLLCLFSFSIVKTYAQDSLGIIHLYWGQVSDMVISTEQIKEIKSIHVHDTIKNRSISEVTKFRFMMQPVLQGEVKVIDGKGAYLNDRMKLLIQNPGSGDRIIITEIYAKVGEEGERKIPVAAVIVVE